MQNRMRTYREHHRLIRMVRELAALLDGQSRRLVDLARRKAIPPGPGEDSPLQTTWPHVGSAFQLLAQHAQAIEAEFKRLGACK